MSSPAIQVKGISKRYKLYHNPITGPVKELLFFWKRRDFYRDFEVVKNASFEIQKGEVVGIIGPNGAGKTTLLKMIAGMLPWDAGDIRVHGKVTALLAMGVGVHPEFTGRENIYYGGLLLGMTRDEIRKKTADIIRFAELGEFIDRPIRTYSSGMRARLLFSISMSIDPDILIVDEALATGDAYFVQKSFARISEMCQSGATILLVSHNLTQIQTLCQRVIFMADNAIQMIGNPSETVASYHQWLFTKESKKNIATRPLRLHSTSGSGEVVLENIRLKKQTGEEVPGFYTGEPMTIELEYSSRFKIPTDADLFVGFCLENRGGLYVGEINTVNYIKPGKPGIHKQKVVLLERGKICILLDSLLLLNNHYSLWIIFYDTQKGYYCEYSRVFPFFVSRPNNSALNDAIFWQPCNFMESSL